MNVETRKINIINWISTIQDEDILSEMEMIQKKKIDWWDSISTVDKKAIQEGLEQLDNGEFLSRAEVRNKISTKYAF